MSVSSFGESARLSVNKWFRSSPEPALKPLARVAARAYIANAFLDIVRR
jgi:hypothetical protein